MTYILQGVFALLILLCGTPIRTTQFLMELNWWYILSAGAIAWFICKLISNREIISKFVIKHVLNPYRVLQLLSHLDKSRAELKKLLEGFNAVNFQSVNKEIGILLLQRAQSGELFQLLLQHSAIAYDCLAELLTHAAVCKNKDVVTVLLTNCKVIVQPVAVVLLLGEAHTMPLLMNYLMKHNQLDVLNKKNDTLQMSPFYWAILTKNIPLVTAMLQCRDIEWNLSHQSPNLLVLAIPETSYCAQIYELLIQYVIKSNRIHLLNEGNHQVRPLFVAVSTQNLSAFRILLANGASTSFTTDFGDTLLQIAVSKEVMELVELLLQQNTIDINSQNKIGWTALFSAIEKKNAELVCCLLKAGADVTVLDNFGMSPLQVAVLIGDICCIEYLLDFKADVTVVTKKGQSLLDLAKKYDDEYIRKVSRVTIPYVIEALKVLKTQYPAQVNVAMDSDTLFEQVCKGFENQYYNQDREEIVRLLAGLMRLANKVKRVDRNRNSCTMG